VDIQPAGGTAVTAATPEPPAAAAPGQAAGPAEREFWALYEIVRICGKSDGSASLSGIRALALSGLGLVDPPHNLAAQEPHASLATVDALAAALAARRIVVKDGKATETRTIASPRAVAVQLLAAIGRPLTDAPEPQPAPELAAQEPCAVPLPHGIALAALECIRQAYEPGTMAHDTAHKAIDDTAAARAANEGIDVNDLPVTPAAAALYGLCSAWERDAFRIPWMLGEKDPRAKTLQDCATALRVLVNSLRRGGDL
jgi:hypothetical protein